MIRLAHGVVAGRDHQVWAPGHDGVPVDAAVADLRPGAAVAVGPADGDADAVRRALGALTRLVDAGGVPAAGAGVDLGDGFRSARLAGARGDRRDAVLAALATLGIDGADRLGERAGVLVALFGPAATKPVGTAATRAVQDGRWSAVRLASAASDLLGPEQLERVLRLTAPDGIVTLPAVSASALADHLAQVLGPVSRPRRLALLVDLWEQVCATRERELRRERLRAVQGRRDRLAELRARHRRFLDDQILDEVRRGLGREPTMADAARWMPHDGHWRWWFGQVLHDALGATVLLRTAVAVADHGLAEGLARCRPLLAAAPILLSDTSAAAAARPVRGLLGVPARPGCYVRDLDRRLQPSGGERQAQPSGGERQAQPSGGERQAQPSGGERQAQPSGRERQAALDWPTTGFVTQRLGKAREYGLVALSAAHDLLATMWRQSVRDALAHRDCGHLRRWREIAGYSPVRPPHDWEQPSAVPGEPSLADRLRSAPDADPIDVERPGDLLWYADLADAVAQLLGHDAAVATYDSDAPSFDVDPDEPDPDPLRPGSQSVRHALAGAARLVSLGADVPARARDWTELVDGLLDSTAVAAARTGGFPLPAPLAARDGVTVPGTQARLELARDPRQLAEWAGYMGNCIAGEDYLGSATAGRCVLAALRDPRGRIVANVELLPPRTRTQSWRIGEFKARFNAEPDPELAQRLERWVAALPVAVRVPAQRPARPHTRGRARPDRRNRLLREAGQALDALAEAALRDTATISALDVLHRMLDPAVPPGADAPDASLAGVVALRRASADRLDEALRRCLGAGRPRLAAVWRATGVRPLATALAGLDPSFRESLGRLDLLVAEAPLLGSARRLARWPSVASARSVDLVGGRVRGALGRLARAGDPALAPAVAPNADTPLLCALVLAVSAAPAPVNAELTLVAAAGAPAVPGFPASSLDDADGPWGRAWPAAVELGADAARRGGRLTLRAPTAWLGAGGWPALWGRAARRAH